ncbi:hypothetical protein HW561_01325 [Rhodobacteraceae bacterium B1Z28]|uniref:Uncharacterized protein n=1 Tax=Ruegeria haliotis TaxID=2747601 RepID=A0ABX2PJY8_9RHOB|nr:hypothetical protein [Ruegeria haliotis]NVO54430.1 hypothetical protein [Ruegeria haliotis]
MFRVIPFASKCAVLVISAHLVSIPAAAQHTYNSTSAFIAVGGKKLSFHHRSKHKVQRYYVAPKSKHHAKPYKKRHSKPVKTHRHPGFKHRKFGYYPHQSFKRHGYKSLKFKHRYRFKRH